eukprot:365267-Chlamydomonas_euryale.AAC.4
MHAQRTHIGRGAPSSSWPTFALPCRCSTGAVQPGCAPILPLPPHLSCLCDAVASAVCCDARHAQQALVQPLQHRHRRPARRPARWHRDEVPNAEAQARHKAPRIAKHVEGAQQAHQLADRGVGVVTAHDLRQVRAARRSKRARMWRMAADDLRKGWAGKEGRVRRCGRLRSRSLPTQARICAANDGVFFSSGSPLKIWGLHQSSLKIGAFINRPGLTSEDWGLHRLNLGGSSIDQD